MWRSDKGIADWSRGFGSIVKSRGIMQSPIVREKRNHPRRRAHYDQDAMGYADDCFPANAVVSRRTSVVEAASFIGYEEN